uniref:Uncharacterized protein n=1 Tax=Arundo donax TaxID=35708 RepID=A0A0A9FJ95_ARUDO
MLIYDLAELYGTMLISELFSVQSLSCLKHVLSA